MWRACRTYDDCKDCPLERFEHCKTVADTTTDHIATLQEWSDTHPEIVELTDEQKEVLRALKVLGFLYIAVNSDDLKDYDGELDEDELDDHLLYAYYSKPRKLSASWLSCDNSFYNNSMSCLFPLCSWSDPEPTSIYDLLRGYDD